MVAAVVGSAIALAIVWSPAEFAAPDDEGVIEHAALFEVSEEGGDGFVDGADEGAVGALDVVVAVPVSGVGLDEADAFFEEASGEEAFPAEGIGVWISDAVGVEGALFFAFEVDEVGNFHLHAVGELVGFHACCEIGVLGIFAGVLVVELCEGIKCGTLVVARLERLRFEVEKRGTSGAEGGSLVEGGEESTGPIF